jgi:polyisoprenoid-binding protein YceI
MHACIVSTSLALLLAAGFTTDPAPAGQAKSAPASGKYKVDPEHSTVLLKVKHLNTSWTFCHFDQVGGDFTVDPAKPESDSLKVVVAASTIASSNPV